MYNEVTRRSVILWAASSGSGLRVTAGRLSVNRLASGMMLGRLIAVMSRMMTASIMMMMMRMAMMTMMATVVVRRRLCVCVQLRTCRRLLPSHKHTQMITQRTINSTVHHYQTATTSYVSR